MSKNKASGYREIEHTADIELHVWAPDLISLLEQSARGMYTLAGIHLTDHPRQSQAFELTFWDRETLLVDFLSELLYHIEDEDIGFDDYQLQIKENKLEVQAKGARVQEQNRAIKAVTYHNLAIRETERGLEVNIVFDI